MPANQGGADGTSDIVMARGLFKQRAYAQIKRMILSGELAPGTFLAERPLANRLEMSTTPVRSALERLDHEGFVTISPQQGAVVRDFSFHEISELYEVRMILEPFVAGRVAGRLSPAQVQRLDASLQAQRENLDRRDIALCVQLDENYHTLFAEFLDNREILRVLQRLRDKTHRLFHRVFSSNPARMEGSYEEHAAIAESMIQGPPHAAVERIGAHLEYGRRLLLDPFRN
jgi:DNA-binding GntR family transcriptional regulator